MIEKLKNSIVENFDRSLSFDLKDWHEVLNDSCNTLVFHLKSTVDYYISYFGGGDLSLVLYENNKAIGVVPLFVHKNEEGWLISGEGVNLIQPLFVDNVASKTKKRLEKEVVRVVYFIANKLEIKTVVIFNANNVLSNWYIFWLKKANKSFMKYQLSIDLQLPINDIKLGFRKSYKPLVNKALKEWNIEVCEYNIDSIFEEFRLLHLEVAGKETRNKKTWSIQKEQIKNKEAFLVTVRDGKKMIGVGLFTYTIAMGSYSIGVYKRELFDKPIGHGVQMKAIEALKDKGCKTYYIGQKMTLLDNNTPTDKELSISHFKEGFAGYVYVQPHLEVFVSE